MTHPLVSDLTKLTDDELATKIGELTRKLSQAYRLGMGDAVHQIQMFLDSYYFELRARNEKALAAMAEKSAEFKNIIDIN